MDLQDDKFVPTTTTTTTTNHDDNDNIDDDNDSVPATPNITMISYSTFESCASLKYVVLPHTIGIIVRNAFSCCPALTNIEFTPPTTKTNNCYNNGEERQQRQVMEGREDNDEEKNEYPKLRVIDDAAFGVASNLTIFTLPTSCIERAGRILWKIV